MKAVRSEICGLQSHDIMIVSWKACCRPLIFQCCERDGGHLANRTSEWLAIVVIWKKCFFFFEVSYLGVVAVWSLFLLYSRRKKSTIFTVLNETVARIIFVTWAQWEGGCDRSSLSPYTTCSFICARQGEKYILCDHSQPDFCHLLLVLSKSVPKRTRVTLILCLFVQTSQVLLLCLNQPIFQQTLHACERICVLPPPFKAAACWLFTKLWHHPEKCAPRSSIFIISNHCESKAEPKLHRTKWCLCVQSHLYVSVDDVSYIW